MGSAGKVAEINERVIENLGLGTLHRIPSDPAAPAHPTEVVAASAPQTLPSTRAGGQDDVSSNKLPQIIWEPISEGPWGQCLSMFDRRVAKNVLCMS